MFALVTAAEEDADDDFKTGPSFLRKADAPATRLSPATVRNMYTTYCIKCYRITYSVDVLPLHWCGGAVWSVPMQLAS